MSGGSLNSVRAWKFAFQGKSQAGRGRLRAGEQVGGAAVGLIEFRLPLLLLFVFVEPHEFRFYRAVRLERQSPVRGRFRIQRELVA